MAWTPEQETFVGDVIAVELQKRLEAGDRRVIAMLFDPSTPNVVKNFLRNRLTAMKVQAQEDRADIAAKAAQQDADLAAQITLIDSILVQL